MIGPVQSPSPKHHLTCPQASICSFLLVSAIAALVIGLINHFSLVNWFPSFPLFPASSISILVIQAGILLFIGFVSYVIYLFNQVRAQALLNVPSNHFTK